MKKSNFLFAYLAFSFFQLKAQNKGGVLWKIEGNNLTKPSYIFGTCHVFTLEIKELVPGFEAAFKNAEVVMPEIAMDSILKDPNYLVQEVRKIRNPGRLSKLVLQLDSITKQAAEILNRDEEKDSLRAVEFGVDSLYQSIKKAAREKTESLDQELDSLKLINEKELDRENIEEKDSSLIYSKYLIGNSQRYASLLDLDIVKEALDSNKRIIGCESIIFQYTLSDKLGEGITDKEFDSLIINLKNKNNIMADLLTNIYLVYANQNLNDLNMDEFVLSQMMPIGTSKEVCEKMMDFVLYDRNKNWIDKFETEFLKHSCFVAVGLAHLPGEKGVLQLLRNKGYTVTPVLE